jgi:hypothetical protein
MDNTKWTILLYKLYMFEWFFMFMMLLMDNTIDDTYVIFL